MAEIDDGCGPTFGLQQVSEAICPGATGIVWVKGDGEGVR